MNFKLSESFYFTVFLIKIVPLTKDSIVKSTTFCKTYYNCANLNCKNLKLSENAYNSNSNTSKVLKRRTLI